uniref:SNW domain-containing protein 1 n=1 Tax=Cebus imitator TaxID=2715852 RepID=A0A2K5Q0D8_CEBIM
TRFLPAPTQLSQDQLEAEEKARSKRSWQTSLVSSRRLPLHMDPGMVGCFPEIPVKKTSNMLAIQVDSEGKIKYDAISKDKVIYSKYTDLVPKEPDEEATKGTTKKTMPVQAADKLAPAPYIRYTPSQQGVAFNTVAKQRVSQIVEMQKEPMEPPRFKINKKSPWGTPSPSPPAPVKHSPSRKMTIPLCISNQKNAKGYTISLDEGLAADGRGLQTVHINEMFAKLGEALHIADRKAREAVEMCAQVDRKMAQKEMEKHEGKLREMVLKARENGAGIKTHVEKDGEACERDEIQLGRRRERQCDWNLSRAGPVKRSKLQRTENRAISEVIALGYDQSLFNQSKGMDSGFAGGEDEIYHVYDQAWRGGKAIAQCIYRSSINMDKHMYGYDLEAGIKTKRFALDKEFSKGPVQLEEDPFGLDKFLEEAKQHGDSSHPKECEHEGRKRRKE